MTKSDAQTVLLPCPFCGSHAASNTIDGTLKVCCGDETDECPAGYNNFTLEQWNTRVPAAQRLVDAEGEAAKASEQPVELSRSVQLSLKAAMALTKKYLFAVGKMEIGDKEITELREVHYQVENALYDLEKAPKRESVSIEAAKKAMGVLEWISNHDFLPQSSTESAKAFCMQAPIMAKAGYNALRNEIKDGSTK
jgi:hypothetical protein